MIFFFGSSFFVVLGSLILVLLAIGGAVAEWITRYSAGVWVILLLCWISYAYQTIISLRGRPETPKFSRILGLFHTIPQLAVIATGYRYFLGQIEKTGAVSSVIDILVCFGVYIAATAAWNKLVVQDKVSKWAAILFSFVHIGISIFVVLAFLFVT